MLKRIHLASHGRTIIGTTIAITGIACILLVRFENAREEERRLACANVMKQIFLAMIMYRNESPREYYPSLSAEPGLLAFNSNTKAQLLAEAASFQGAHLVEESKKQLEEINWSPETVPNNAFTDKDYFYLGYAVADEGDIENYARAYRESVLAGRPLDEDVINPDEADQVKRIIVIRLREGAQRLFYERFSGPWPGDPRADEKSMRQLPVLIERTGNHNQPGGHVLYMDGHVEFIEYPGKWPMTEKTVRILNELDALGSTPNR